MKTRLLLVFVFGLLTTMVVALEFQLHYAQSEFIGMTAVTDELVLAVAHSAKHAGTAKPMIPPEKFSQDDRRVDNKSS